MGGCDQPESTEESEREREKTITQKRERERERKTTQKRGRE